MHDKLLLMEGFTQTIQDEVKLSNCRLFLEHFEDTVDIDRTANNGTRQLALYSLVYTPTILPFMRMEIKCIEVRTGRPTGPVIDTSNKRAICVETETLACTYKG